MFIPKPIYIGKRKLLPDALPDMMQEDNIIVLLVENDINGISPQEWMDEHFRIRQKRDKKGRYI